MGLVSVEMFTRAWLGFLRVVASLVLVGRKQITTRAMLGRLNEGVTQILLCALTLILCFHLYLQVYGLGSSQPEQVVYFLACVVRLGSFFMTAGERIEALFDPRP
jgi:hypothetical protein